jgi:hypothetical protein
MTAPDDATPPPTDVHAPANITDHCTMVIAWGIPNPRVASAITHENQAGEWRRRQAVGKRAKAAGWPVESPTVSSQRQAQQRALRRLERAGGLRFGHRYAADGTRSDHRYAADGAVVAYQSRHYRDVTVTADDLDSGDGESHTIFDE